MIQSGFRCSNLTNYDLTICLKFVLLCEECSVNNCGENFQKRAEKKLNVLQNCGLKIFDFI